MSFQFLSVIFYKENIHLGCLFSTASKYLTVKERFYKIILQDVYLFSFHIVPVHAIYELFEDVDTLVNGYKGLNSTRLPGHKREGSNGLMSSGLEAWFRNW